VGKANHPGEYLQARRARVTPAEVGLVPGPRRRLARLRRDELAMLAANPIDRAGTVTRSSSGTKSFALAFCGSRG